METALQTRQRWRALALAATVAAGLFLLGVRSCKTDYPASYPAVQTGKASYYHDTLANKQTASGDSYNPNAFTAAHRTLPLGTRVLVTNLSNHESVIVRINDRGPFVEGRIIDLSRRAAKQLNMLEDGVVRVRVRVLGRG